MRKWWNKNYNLLYILFLQINFAESSCKEGMRKQSADNKFTLCTNSFRREQRVLACVRHCVAASVSR